MTHTIAVVGATGIQGGSVISTLLKEGIFKIRGITRNPTSTKALALAASGVEIVKADLNDEASLVAAFKVLPPPSLNLPPKSQLTLPFSGGIRNLRGDRLFRAFRQIRPSGCSRSRSRARKSPRKRSRKDGFA